MSMAFAAWYLLNESSAEDAFIHDDGLLGVARLPRLLTAVWW